VSPGTAADNESRAQDGHKGPDSEHFKQNISSQQSEVCLLLLSRKVMEKGIDTKQPVWPDKFNEIQYNNPKGK
jgi:hypothetical protein